MLERYLVIEPSGDLRWIELERKDLLDVFYKEIGCSCIESVRSVWYPIYLIVDDVGRLLNPPKPHNELASRLYPGWILGDDDIVGSVILVAVREDPNSLYHEYDFFPLNLEELEILSIYMGINIPKFPAMFSDHGVSP